MILSGQSEVSSLAILETAGFADYRLLDSGNGRKLERFSSLIVDRPEPQALWRPRLPLMRWSEASAAFSAEDDKDSGKWRCDKPLPSSWPVVVQDITMHVRLGSFLHLGIFPEQLPHWEWTRHCIDGTRRQIGSERPRVLNLFGYTGAASLIAARAGAEVVHVDASKKAIAWARENQVASGLQAAPIRWLVEDARKFVAREIRRGRTYHVVLIDPPKFGRGPEGEVWELFAHLAPLLRDCVQLLDKGSAALVLTAYAIRASALAIGQLAAECLEGRSGLMEVGELAIREHQGTRRIPTSMFARWSSHAP